MLSHSVEKDPDRVYKWIFVAVTSVLVLRTLYLGVRAFQYPYWADFSDYLYNYSGGFIRRGLTGEILIFLKNTFSISPLTTCVVTSLMGYFALAYFIISKFREKGYFWGMLIMGFMLGGVLIFDLAALRRDYIEMALFLAIICLFNKIRCSRWLLFSNLIAIFGILLHEATFFFIVPVCVLLTNVRLHNIFKSAVMWLPATLAFVACCIWKGNAEMYGPIIDTARTLCPEKFANGVVPAALTFIEKGTTDVFWFHIWVNFTQPLCGLPIPVGLITVFYFFYVPYITIAMLKVFSRPGVSNKSLGALMSLIGFQFVCLLPMFTILSCDICRVCFYWIMSSLIVWLTLGESEIESMFFPKYNRISKKLVVKMMAPRLARNRPLLTFCAMCIGVTFWVREPISIIRSCPVGTVASTVKLAVNKIAPILNIKP